MKFVVKWLLDGAIFTLLLVYFTNVTFWTAIVAATILTIIAYFIGDQLILRMTNNTVATLSDGILTILYLWIATFMMDWTLSFGEMIIMAVVLGAAEWFLHRYIFQDRSYAR